MYRVTDRVLNNRWPGIAWRHGALAAFFMGLCLTSGQGQATILTFAPGQYDNTANTVTGTNAAPVYTNNQTTGNFRDVFWWGRSFNGGVAGVTSPDFINTGKNLVSNGGAPPSAVVGGSYDALNFTGLRTSGGGSPFPGTTFLTIYDKTPGNNATSNLFDASVPGGLTISADVLFTPGQHSASAGLVAMYANGQNGLGLLARNSGGNNPDLTQLDLVYQYAGTGTIIQSTSLGAGGTHFTANNWYRIEMNVTVSGDAFTVTGKFSNHVTPTDPTSAVGSLIATVNYSDSLSAPGNALDLTNPGEIGLMAMTTESFSDGVQQNGGTGANPLNDNIGVSFTNFQFDELVTVAEPSTVLLGALGMGGLSVLVIRRGLNRGFIRSRGGSNHKVFHEHVSSLDGVRREP
jgi:hypothetical protein